MSTRQKTGIWYIDDPALGEMERQGFIRFKKEYGNPNMQVLMGYDKQKRLNVRLKIPFRMSNKSPWKTYDFLVVYSNNHPGRNEGGQYGGGTIKIYCLTNLKPGFHHLLSDGEGNRYVCQSGSAHANQITGYKAMRHLVRWLQVYQVWEKTGVDIDR